MMKFTTALVLFSAVVTRDKIFARAEEDNAGETKEVKYEKYWKASADWDPKKTPLNEYYKYEEGSDDLKCEAIQSPPIENSLSNGQMPQYCAFKDDEEIEKRCCSTSHDIFIKSYVLEGLWPDECDKKDFYGLRELACLACHPRQPEYTFTDPTDG